jgi:phosphoglycolate phosphatase-like HAD superfamily hydrolase
MARIRYVILDFDGTCTQVDRVSERFLSEYGKAIHADDKAWDRALATVRKAAPDAGWTLANAPSTAPAGADPFILAGEASALLARARGGNAPDVFKAVYNSCVAPFRTELIDVLDALTKKVKVAFISNSGETDIGNRLTDLLPPKLRAKIHISGGAQKFLVKEPLLDSKLSAAERARFEQLDGALRVDGLKRPIYLRRGSYFEAMCDVYNRFGDAEKAIEKKLEETLVCGDIYELDLAMPAALGTQVHLIERAEPFPLYEYERARMGKGQISASLKALNKRVS